MGGAPTSFPFVTSAEVEIKLQNFLAIILTLFPHWCKSSSSCLALVPNSWTWTTTPQQKCFFWSNPYKIEIIKTSLTEILVLPNFPQWPSLHYNLNHDIKFCCWRYVRKLWRQIFFFKNHFKKIWGSHFFNIIKILSMFIKTSLKDSKNVRNNLKLCT